MASFTEIHALGVIHGDVRPENILVSEEEGKVWVIDFEFAEILVDGDGDADSKVAEEIIALNDMLADVKRRRALGDGASLPPTSATVKEEERRRVAKRKEIIPQKHY